MTHTAAPQAPPFCPNPTCDFHRAGAPGWRFHRDGTHSRLAPPHRVQRYRCCHCGRHFCDQTFRTTYWLKRPELLLPTLHRLLGCSAFRQIAREFRASPQTIALHCARLGRHSLLHHLRHRPRGRLTEPLAMDSFQSFEWSQFHPTLFHTLVGRASHFCHGFTDSELRRSGSMTAAQKRQRRLLESTLGRPDPRSIEHEVARLLAIALPEPQEVTLHTDEHQDYPRALARLRAHTFHHHTVSSRAARTPHNPLFPVNLLDLLIRHNGANHKRETIAFSRRRQSAAERLWVLITWRNWMKHFSERKREGSPAMRLGLRADLLEPEQLLAARLFPSHSAIPERWADYYWRRVPTRGIANCRLHRRTYAN